MLKHFTLASKLMLALMLITYSNSLFSQSNNLAKERISSFGLGFGLFNKSNTAYGIDYLYSSKSFALSCGVMGLNTKELINHQEYESEISFKIGLLAPIKGNSYFTFLAGISRISGYNMEYESKPKRLDGGWVWKTREKYTLVRTFGLPIQTDINIALNRNIGLGVKGFTNLNRRAIYYGCLGSLRFTFLHKRKD